MQTCPLTPSTLAAAALLVLASPLALAADACAAPNFSAAIPDGTTASSEQMTSTQTAVTDFVKAGEAYILCVEASESSIQAQRKRDNMLDEMEKIAANFNRQLRQWKKNNKT
jgi:HAMP domain-containing protein